jgi:hypothetical protein
MFFILEFHELHSLHLVNFLDHVSLTQPGHVPNFTVPHALDLINLAAISLI